MYFKYFRPKVGNLTHKRTERVYLKIFITHILIKTIKAKKLFLKAIPSPLSTQTKAILSSIWKTHKLLWEIAGRTISSGEVMGISVVEGRGERGKRQF